MSDKILLCGNWKMKLNAAQSAALAAKLTGLAAGLKKTDVWVAPTFTSIPAAVAVAGQTAVKVGAQNVHWEADGAFTGEVSVPMLKEAGCEFAITGHSERRHIMGEDNNQCAKRTAAAIKQDLTVIFCVGETLDERKKGVTNQVLEAQMEPLIKLLEGVALKGRLIIAYEPVWAIGTGVVAQVPDIKNAHQAIFDYWTKQSKEPCPAILYGGSVSPENLKEILNVPLVAGGLIGGASLKFESLQALAAIAEQS